MSSDHVSPSAPADRLAAIRVLHAETVGHGIMCQQSYQRSDVSLLLVEIDRLVARVRSLEACVEALNQTPNSRSCTS